MRRRASSRRRACSPRTPQPGDPHGRRRHRRRRDRPDRRRPRVGVAGPPRRRGDVPRRRSCSSPASTRELGPPGRARGRQGRRRRASAARSPTGCGSSAGSRVLVAALGGVVGRDARRRRDQRPVHPVPGQRPRRQPGVGRPARGRPDALDDPRRRRSWAACRPRVQHPAPVRRRHRRPRPVRRPAVDRARSVGPAPDRDVRGRLVRDAGAGDDDDDRPAARPTNETRGRVAGALNAAIQTASIVLHGGGRHPRRRHRDPRGVRGRRRGRAARGGRRLVPVPRRAGRGADRGRRAASDQPNRDGAGTRDRRRRVVPPGQLAISRCASPPPSC